MINNLPTKERFVCSGYCMFHVPTEEETQTDAPPKNITNFVGTVDEAISEGWEQVPKEKAYIWHGFRDITWMCPKCSERDGIL